FILMALAGAACSGRVPDTPRASDSLTARLQPRLPTGVRLDPAAALEPLGPMALTMRVSPERDRLVVLLSGYSMQGLHVIDPAGRYPYDVERAHNGRVYVSTWGGNTLAVLEPLDAGGAWMSGPEWIDVARHPSTLLFNADGSRLFVASGSTDHVAVLDTKTNK